MTDIVKRLRNATALTRKDLFPLCADALDEIEHLRALITAWADWELPPDDDCGCRLCTVQTALRKAVGR